MNKLAGRQIIESPVMTWRDPILVTERAIIVGDQRFFAHRLRAAVHLQKTVRRVEADLSKLGFRF